MKLLSLKPLSGNLGHALLLKIEDARFDSAIMLNWYASKNQWF
jgi:hypothetical protein